MGVVHIIHRFIHLTRYLRFIGGYRFYQLTALPFSIATVFSRVHQASKRLKLMALAEGISIRQYIDGWLMTTNSKQQCTGGASCREPGLDHKFLKNQIYFQLH